MQFKKLLPVLGITAVLSGCLDKLEQLTQETKDSVERTEVAIDGTHYDTKLGGAIGLLPEDIAQRSAAAEVMFIMGPEDRIYKYIGATMPLAYYMGMGNKFPNVTFIGTKADSTKNLAPVSPEKYEIMEVACMRVLRELALKSQLKLSDAELADVKSKANRMFLVATTLLGALPGPVREEGDRSAIDYALQNQKVNQQEAKQLLNALASLFDDATRSKVRTLIDVRFDNVQLDGIF